MRLHRFLDFSRAQTMTRDVDDVVGATEHEVIAVGVADRPVEGRIDLFARNSGEVRLDEARVVAPNRRHAAWWQGRHDGQHALLVGADFSACRFVEQAHVVARGRE